MPAVFVPDLIDNAGAGVKDGIRGGGGGGVMCAVRRVLMFDVASGTYQQQYMPVCWRAQSTLGVRKIAEAHWGAGEGGLPLRNYHSHC